MSDWCLSKTCSVARAVSESTASIPKQHERPGPVDRLGDGRVLLEIEGSQRPDDPRHLVGELVADTGDLGEHDGAFALEGRVVEVEEQATPLQSLGEIAGVVGGEEHERDLSGADRPELGDRDLVVGKDLEQERLGLDLETVYLVDEEHDGVGGADGLEEGPGQAGIPRRRGPPRATPIRGVVPLRRLRLPVRPGCATTASCSSTRRGPWPRRGPRSTAVGSALRPRKLAVDLASSVLPVPAGPSTRMGLASRSARYTTPARPSSAM